MRTLSKRILMIALGLLAGSSPASMFLQDSDPPSPTPPVPETETTILDVDELLLRLETAAEGLRDFQSPLTFVREDTLGARTTFAGRMVYQAVPREGEPAMKRFAIHFETRIADGRRWDRDERFIFDGRWLAEINHQEKAFIQREIVEPGRTFDPLKLGEGPFPLPIGQPREEVKQRYETKLIDPPSEGFLSQVLRTPVYGLELIPRQGTAEYDDYEYVHVFYDQKTFLPVAVDAMGFSERQIVWLRDMQVNKGIDEAEVTIRAPGADSGWSISIRPWGDG